MDKVTLTKNNPDDGYWPVNDMETTMNDLCMTTKKKK